MAGAASDNFCNVALPLSAALVLSALGLPGQALAQAGSNSNAPPSSGIVPGRDYLEGLTREDEKSVPRLSIEGGIERSPCPLADPQFDGITLTINEANFNGLGPVNAAELIPAWKPFAGREISVSAICEIRDAAATILRNKGYLAAVQVPTQRIEDGTVQFEVLFGRIASVRARGETRGAEKMLRQYLGRLSEDEIFNRNRAERYLLLSRDLPGYNVLMTLKPAGTEPGELIAEVRVLRRPYALDLTLQNLGSKATGRIGAQIKVQVFGLTGMGDATGLSYYVTEDFKEQHILRGTHEFRLGSDGLVIGGQVTHAWTKPDLGTVSAQLDSTTLFASLHARYPVKRSQGENLWVAGGLDYADQNVNLLGPLTRDKLRVAWARVNFDAVDLAHRRPKWRIAGQVELRQGFDLLGASKTCTLAACPAGAVPTSRIDGDPAATLVRATGVVELARGDVSILLAPRGQYAFKPLLGFEEFSAGNYTVGRGYDPGTLVGDHGLGMSAEMRGPWINLGQVKDLSFQPYLFGDVAVVWDKGGFGSERLTSAGGGLRAVLGDRFRFDATLAVPTSQSNSRIGGNSARLLMSLTTRLLPWRKI